MLSLPRPFFWRSEHLLTSDFLHISFVRPHSLCYSRLNQVNTMVLDRKFNREARPHGKTLTVAPQVKDPYRGLSKEVNEACDHWLRGRGIASRQWASSKFNNKSVTSA